MKKILSSLVIVSLLFSLVGCTQETSEEVYEATTKGFGGDVTVKLTYSDDKISKVEIEGNDETEGVGSLAIEQMPDSILEANSADVDTVSGATITSNAIITAAKMAIMQKTGETSAEIEFTPGTYSSIVSGHQGEVQIETTFDESSITNVEVVSQNETYGIGYGMDTTPVEVLPSKIVESQSLAVDTVTGATVTSNAIIEGVSDAVVQAGVDPDILKMNEIQEEAVDINETTQVVVVGGGAAGLSAAISAQESGAEVIIVEKQDIVGGAMTRSGGKLMAAGTEAQEEQGISDSADKMYEYLMSVGDGLVDAQKVRDFSDNSLEIYNWMVDMGVEIQDVEPIHQSVDTPRVHNTLGGGGMTSGFGGNITVPMYEKFIELNGTVIYGTTVDTIIMEDGIVKGVSGVKSDGSKVVINADAVIVATGDHTQDKESVTSYGKSFPFVASTCPTGNVGDGIKMAEAIGAQIKDNEAVQVVFLDFNSGVGINEEAGLILSMDGVRVANEFTYQYHVGDALAKAGSTSGWYIATSTDTEPTVQYAMTLDSTIKATSIEDLAKQMDVDVTVLKDTIEHYNELCAAKNDTDFNKPAEYLYPIEGDTYYAMKLLPSITVTYDGILTDTDSQVLDTNNNVILGLYAAGATTNMGIIGTEYPGCGTAISGGAYAGFVAGKNAAEYINK